MKNKKWFLALGLLASVAAFAVDVKISQLPLGTASSTGANDSFPYVDQAALVTRRLKLADLINLPAMNATYAPIASPTFTGVVTAPTFIGALTGQVTGNVTGNLTGNVTGNVTGSLTGGQVHALASPIPTADGGTGQDLSASNGFLKVIAGVVSAQASPIPASVGGTGANLGSSNGLLRINAGVVTTVASPLPTNIGGTGQDLSSSNGFLKVNAGVVSTQASPIPASVGGTGANLGSSNGLLRIDAGVVSTVASPLPTNLGGTGQDLSSSNGVMQVKAGVVSVQASPMPVGIGGTGLSSGTSGGIPYFSSTSAMTSSTALSAHSVVIGGGPGAAPSPLPNGGSASSLLKTGTGSVDPSWQVMDAAANATTVALRDSSGDLFASTFHGALTGTASGNTTYSANNHGVVISGSGNTMTVIAPDASTSKVLTSGGASADPTWQTPTAQVPGRNFFINGNFDIRQRQPGTTESFSNGAATYTFDRWRTGGSGATAKTWTIAESTDVPTTSQSGFTSTNSYLWTATNSPSLTSVDVSQPLTYKLEGYDLQPLFGTQVTVSFWVKATDAGTYSFGIRNNAGNRAYVTTYTINSGATWEFKTITLTWDTTTTGWVFTNGLGALIDFACYTGSGDSHQTSTLGSWQSANVMCANTATNYFVNAHTLQFAQVALTQGAGLSATQFFRAGSTVAGELALAKRYYQKSYDTTVAVGTATTTGAFGGVTVTNAVSQQFHIPFGATMRADPTVTAYNNSSGASGTWQDSGASAITATPTNAGTSGFYMALTSAHANATVNGHWTADAEL